MNRGQAFLARRGAVPALDEGAAVSLARQKQNNRRNPNPKPINPI